jgi:peptidoglycan/LPS O-acetylase OafA/YrhL
MKPSGIAVEAPDHIPRLDVLRALAILLVVVFHYFSLNAVPALDAAQKAGNGFGSTTDFIIGSGASLGTTGVPLFFVISGFCIHLSVLRRRAFFQARDFYSRRFLRIYPAYFCALAVFSLLGAFKILNSLNLKMFLTHLFLVHNLFNHSILLSINAAFWSLAVECQFYLLYPLALIVRRGLGLKACLFLTLLICISEQIACSLSPAFTQFSQYQFCLGTTLGTWCTWILGACLAEAYEQRKRFFHHRVFWVITSIALFIVGRSFPFIFEFRFLLDAFLAAVLMELYLASTKPLALIERLLVPVGLVSYSIYLWHQPLIKPLWSFLRAHCSLPETAFGEIVFFFPLTLLILSPVFIVSYWLTERTAPRWIRRWASVRATNETSSRMEISAKKKATAD